MSKRIIRIYVEGEGEIRFFTQLIAYHFDKKFTIGDKILKSTYDDDNMEVIMQVYPKAKKNEQEQKGGGGIDPKTLTNVMTEIQNNQMNGIDSFVIIDADTPIHKPAGGCKARIEYLEKRKKEFDINFGFFIIPNYETDGNLEDLLDSMISQNGQPFYNCLTAYIDCLGKLEKDSIPLGLQKNKDLIKTKFEWYSYYMTDDKKSSLAIRPYKNDAWDLGAEKLKPLLSFFDRIFNNS